MISWLLRCCKGTIIHPQWMTDRFHIKTKKCLEQLRNAVVVDIGSGDASYLEFIHPSNTLYTIDYPGTNKEYKSKPKVFSDARCLPIASSKVDVVLLFEVLEHVAETKKVMDEIKRVLRPDGELYLSVPFLYPIHDAPNDYWRFTTYGISEVLAENDFDRVKLVVYGNTIVSAMQMFNLGLLELCRDFFKCSKVLGTFVSFLVYPLTVAINLIAWPLFYLPLGTAGNFGCFLTARRK